MEDINKTTCNVGIKHHQKLRITKLLEYGQSINKYVQDAVEDKLKHDEVRDNGD